jgi:hypothetical protein
MFVRALACIAIFGAPMLAVCKLNQAVDTFSSAKNDTSTIAAVAAVWSSLGNIFLSTKGHAAVTTPSRFNFNFRSIDKHFFLAQT